MKKFLKDNKKTITIVGIALLAVIFIGLIYNIFFVGSGGNRYEGIKSHKLSKEEISNVKDVVNNLDEIKNVKVYTESKIIKIFVTLDHDVEFDEVKEIANKTISKFKKDNLEFYDLEFFVETKDDSKLYPKIGYKHKSNEKFVW